METYIDELETEKMSMASLNRTAEVIVKHCTNVQALDEFPKIGEQLNKSVSIFFISSFFFLSTNTMPLLVKTSMVLQNTPFKTSECAFIFRFV
jgi:hypothetical protein